MSTYLRQKDPNHLITVGNEGFFGPDSPYRNANPFGTPGNVNPGTPDTLDGYVGLERCTTRDNTQGGRRTSVRTLSRSTTIPTSISRYACVGHTYKEPCV